MGASCPKQYLPLLGKPLLWHTLTALVAVPRLAVVCVVISAEDEWWDQYDWSALGAKLRVLRVGGATRAETVTHALEALGDELHAQDWVLVHDAARACVTAALIDALLDALLADPVGGLLALPLADTLKRSDAQGRVAQTVSREAMWQAQTPQMFRYAALLEALRATPGVTDVAGAMEARGAAPRLVAADATNFKVTYPQDLALAEIILRARSMT